MDFYLAVMAQVSWASPVRCDTFWNTCCNSSFMCSLKSRCGSFFKQQRKRISFRTGFVEVHRLSTRGQQSKAKHLLLCCPSCLFLFVPFTRAEQFILNKTHHPIATFTKNRCFYPSPKVWCDTKTLKAIRWRSVLVFKSFYIKYLCG